jgi:hypothetical protein
VNEPRPPGKPRRPRRAPGERLTWREKLLALIQSDPLVNTIVAVAVAVGFFHGWLKIRFPSPATTFIYDAILIVALVLTYFKMPARESFIPRGPIGNALKAFYLLCFLLLVMPWSPPFLIALAAIRGWCFATLMFCLGYRLTKSLPQVKGYCYVLILLGVITAVYGIRQSPEEVEKMIQEDEAFADRYGMQYYVSSTGRQLRRFSTFVSSGAFGSTLAYVSIFAIVLMTDPKTVRNERLLLFLSLVPIGYAIVLSGSRTSLVSLIFGFLVIAWHRRSFFNWVVIPALFAIMLYVGAVLTGGSAIERYQSVLDFNEVYQRNRIPTVAGWYYMLDGHLLGGGLGRSGYSVPSFLPARLGFNDFSSADGDLGRLIIEMGILGMVFFGQLIVVTVRETLRSLKRLADTPYSTVALASAACIVMAIGTFPSGSPFLGIPMGTLVWFFVGTLMKLSDEYEAGRLQPAEAPVEPSNAPEPVRKRFLHHRRRRGHS